MQHIVYYTTTILVANVGIFIWLERKIPYRKGLPVLRDGFWVDMVWYTLIQSYFLKILIFDYVIAPMDRAWHLSTLLSCPFSNVATPPALRHPLTRSAPPPSL